MTTYTQNRQHNPVKNGNTPLCRGATADLSHPGGDTATSSVEGLQSPYRSNVLIGSELELPPGWDTILAVEPLNLSSRGGVPSPGGSKSPGGWDTNLPVEGLQVPRRGGVPPYGFTEPLSRGPVRTCVRAYAIIGSGGGTDGTPPTLGTFRPPTRKLVSHPPYRRDGTGVGQP